MKKTPVILLALLLMVLSVTSVFASPVYSSPSDIASNQLVISGATPHTDAFAVMDSSYTKMSAMYIGNSRTKIFHDPECKWAKIYVKDKPHEVVPFNTRSEAVEAGFRPCKGCKP